MHGQSTRKSQNLERDDGNKCARRWTASQLQRKRQLDRESQRVAREKTKNKISYLESLVKSFQENEDDRIRKLLKKIDDQAAEIQKLRDILRGINRLIDGSNNTSNSTEELHEPESPQEDPAFQLEHDESRDVFEPSDPIYGGLPCAPDAVQASLALPMDESIVLEDLASPEHRLAKPHTIARLAASIAEDQGLDGKLWYLAGGVLSYLLQARNTETSFSACDDEDIAIRAVFEGWSAVTERYHLDSGWQWLKELDERIYYRLDPHNRLMHMRNTRLVFLNQVCPSANVQRQIPSFMRSQSTKTHSQYDPLAEHFPWPGFRHRLSFSPLKFATDKFMDTLRTYVDFTWNQEARELYTCSSLDGRYQYSEGLLTRIMDIRCYTAKREFFHAFPELKADIPCSAPSIQSLIPFVVQGDTDLVEEGLFYDDLNPERYL